MKEAVWSFVVRSRHHGRVSTFVNVLWLMKEGGRCCSMKPRWAHLLLLPCHALPAAAGCCCLLPLPAAASWCCLLLPSCHSLLLPPVTPSCHSLLACCCFLLLPATPSCHSLLLLPPAFCHSLLLLRPLLAAGAVLPATIGVGPFLGFEKPLACSLLSRTRTRSHWDSLSCKQIGSQ